MGSAGMRFGRNVPIAETLGFRGDFRQWEHLLQIGGG